MPFKESSRRDFLRQSVAAAATTAPLFIPASALGRAGRPAPSERITVGMIGCGKRGNSILGRAMRYGDFQFVAVAEIEGNRRDDRAARMERHHAKERASGSYRGCTRYVDFRELLDRPDIDAVLIATPDHWHCIPVVEAAKRKKDIYCEKPLSLTLEEAKLMVDAVAKHEIVFQTGSQQRSEYGGKFHRACELVRNGRIGQVKEVYVNVGGPSKPCDLPAEEVPPRTDWDRWLGPAPWRGYHERLCPQGIHNHFPAFRAYLEYSGGGMTDIGAHHFDIAQWGLDRDRSGPIEILPPDGEARPLLTYVYEDGVRLYHGSKTREGEGVRGIRFLGTEGMLEVDRGSMKSNPASVLEEVIGENETRLYKSSDHMGNWLECIRSRKDPICTAEIGARSVAVCHLGNLAYWHGRKLRWDPAAWEFPGDAEANGWRSRPRRAPWSKIEIT